MSVEKMAEEEVRAQPTAHIEDVPPLKHGERLTRDEFERRYEAMPHLKKAELIEGVVYMPSPVRIDLHGRPHAQIMAWLGAYWIATPGVDLADNSTVYLDSNNEPQPDALLRIEPAQGGRSRIINKGYVEGAPELIVEVAGTSADYDLQDKLEVYQRCSVQEYIVWQTQEGRLDWFQLVNGKYVAFTPNAEGVIESQIFPGLRLAVPALLAGDRVKVSSELQIGLQTTAHAAFVERLATT
jgi:Uma2 family endonuclease